MKKLIFINLIFFLLLLSGCSFATTHESEKLVAQKGSMTLLSDDLSNNNLVALEGEWSFYWRQLLSSKEIEQAKLRKESDYIEVPNTWESKTGTMHGFATYSLTLQIPYELTGQILGVYIPHQYSSYYLFADGVLIAANGRVGIDKASSEPAFIKELAYFRPNNSTINLTL